MHCISIYLINKRDLREDKIDSIVSDKMNKINFTQLGDSILAFSLSGKDLDKFKSGKTVARIETDYFGGAGEQHSTVWQNGKIIYGRGFSEYSDSPINDALKILGVIRTPGLDEFDTVGLQKYRTNEDFN